SHQGPIPMIRQRWVNDRSSVSGRAMADRRSVHVHDILGEEGLEFEIARTMSVADGCRTLLGAPLLREGEPIGALVLRRAEVHQSFYVRSATGTRYFGAHCGAAL